MAASLPIKPESQKLRSELALSCRDCYIYLALENREC